MQMVKVNVSKLSGAALDWCVAKCEKRIYGIPGTIYEFQPSRCWAQGGPIIEKEILEIYKHNALECWAAKNREGDLRYGHTILIAAMRCYVASKLGDVVEVPAELLK